MRLGTLRSKSGCPTCKIRHVKCDETKPNCLKCTSTGRTCDYPKSTTDKKALVTTSDHPKKLVYSIPFKIPGSQKDRRIFHYYCVQAANDLSGFIPSDFWTTMLLQSSHQEPLVRNVLIAFGSVKMAFESESSGNTSPTMSPDSLMQYDRAIRHVGRYISSSAQPSPLVVLQACILLYYFDIMRGDHKAALTHLRNSLAILRNPSSHNSTPSYTGSGKGYQDDMNEVEAVLARMDLQATMFDDSRTPEYRPSPLQNQDTHHFSDTKTAERHLSTLLNHLWTFLTVEVEHKFTPTAMLPPHITQRKHHLLQSFTAWETAFAHLRHVTTPVDPTKKPALDLLTLHFASNKLLLETSFTFPDQTNIFTVSPNPTVEALLDMAEGLINSTVGKQGRRFSAETGVVAPLFLIVMKCTDLKCRYRAAGLLRGCGRREALYDSGMVVDVVEAIEIGGLEDDGAGVGQGDGRERVEGEAMALEFLAVEAADEAGGLGVMAEMLGVKGDFGRQTVD